jgi:hypothetical protein
MEHEIGEAGEEAAGEEDVEGGALEFLGHDRPLVVRPLETAAFEQGLRDENQRIS